MVEQIVLADCNIVFDLNGFNRWKIPHTIAQDGQHNNSSPTNGDVGHASNGLGGDICWTSVRTAYTHLQHELLMFLASKSFGESVGGLSVATT